MDDDPEHPEEVVQDTLSDHEGSDMECVLPPVMERLLSPDTDARWKTVFYANVQPRALELQEARLAKRHQDKMLEKKRETKEPPDHLCQDWFSEEALTLEARTYLLDKLLPTLVPGVEKLLEVAERKKVLGADGPQEPSRFDPINFLGEYLMRHNPAYQIGAQPSPYVRGMKAVVEKMKSKVPKTVMHKLAEMKTLVEEKRHQREKVEKIKTNVKDIRKEALALQFKEWTQDASGQIPLALIQSALRSFLEVVSSTAPDLDTGIYARPLETVRTLELKVNEEEFVEYLLSYIKNFDSDMFEQLLKHLLESANDAREIIRHDFWRGMFLSLFFECDHAKVGLLDRRRVLSLLESYHDHALKRARKGFRDPRKWPIIELDDIELSEFWGDMKEEDLSKLPSPKVPTPPRRLSEEAAALNLILKEILSDVELAPLETKNDPEEPASANQEEAKLEEKSSTAGEVGKVASGTALQDPSAMPAGQQEPGEPGAQGEEVLPVAEATEVSMAEEAKEDGGPKPTELIPPRLVVEMLEEDENAAGADVSAPSSLHEFRKPSPSAPAPSFESMDGSELLVSGASVSELASSLQKLLEESMDGDEAHETGAEEAGVPTEPGEEAAPGEQEAEGQVDTEASKTLGEGKAGDLVPPSVQTSETTSFTPQLVYGSPWLGELPASDLSFQYSDYGKEVREDWNNENSRFPDLRMNMIEIQSRGPPFCTSAFEKDSLNLPQFVQLMETFVGEEATLLNLKRLVEFVKEGYVQTEYEKINQLERVRHSSFLAWQELLLAGLFEKWDNECSGFLDMQEVDAVLSTFKEGMEQEALNKAKLQLPIPQWHPSGVVKLSLKDFQAYIELVVSELTGDEDEVLDNLVEFLMMAVERSHLERLRGSARRKWLLGIEHTARTSGGCTEPIYQAVFKALARDADAHGGSKKISASISLLEYNLLIPARGDILLRYVACTEEDAPYVLNQSLFMDMKGISFAAALDDKPIHVPRVQLHGNIHFWNYDRPRNERKGSFLVLPLEDIRRRVFGVLGLDTLRDQSDQTIFVPQEIRFYQGVAHSFSIAYHHLRTRDSLMQMVLTALEWLSTRMPGIQSIVAYFMEPGETRMHDYILRKALASDLKGPVEIPSPPAPVLSRKDNLFRDYLFKCADCSLVVPAYVYKEHHITVPLRDPKGQAIMVFDFNLGQCQRLSTCEHKDLQKMMRILQAATCEILKEDCGDLEPYYVLEAEYVGDWRRGGVLFYRFMLQDLQNCIWNLDPWLSFGEIRCFEQPPPLVHTILKCVLLVLYPQWAGTEQVESWRSCIQKLDGELIENICYFDPTAAYVEIRPEILYSCLQGADRKAVWTFGSAPIEHLYNWTHTCLSLIELAKKLQHRESTAPSSSVLLTPTLSHSLRSSQISTNLTTSVA